MYGAEFDKYYGRFVKGRKETEKTSAVPGQAKPDAPASASGAFVPRPQDPAAAATERALAMRRKFERAVVASVLAPGGNNGIAAPIFQGDELIEPIDEQYELRKAAGLAAGVHEPSGGAVP
jgi:hypothetical protein